MEEITAQILVMPLEALDSYSNDPFKLVLYNDNINTFDHVIGCMMIYLMKTPTEAIQIAMTVDNKGKAIILGSSTIEEIEPVYGILTKNNLTCAIEC